MGTALPVALVYKKLQAGMDGVVWVAALLPQQTRTREGPLVPWPLSQNLL